MATPDNVVPMNGKDATTSAGIGLGTTVFVAVAAAVAGAVVIRMLDRYVFKDNAAAAAAAAATPAEAPAALPAAETRRDRSAPIYIQLPAGQQDEFFARLAGGGYE